MPLSLLVLTSCLWSRPPPTAKLTCRSGPPNAFLSLGPSLVHLSEDPRALKDHPQPPSLLTFCYTTGMWPCVTQARVNCPLTQAGVSYPVTQVYVNSHLSIMLV